MEAPRLYPSGGVGAARQSATRHPLSRDFGYDRGFPIDRHYIERFLSAQASDVRGHVLEIADDIYTRRFGATG